MKLDKGVLGTNRAIKTINFQKISECSLTPHLLIFGKSYCGIFPEFMAEVFFIMAKICSIIFWIRNEPPLKLFRKFILSCSPIRPLKDKLNCWQKRTSWMGWLPFIHTWLLSSPPWRWCQTRGGGPLGGPLDIVISYWLSLVLANYWLLLVIVGRSTHFDANLLIYFSCVSPSMKLVSDKGGDWSSWEILAPIQPERAELESVWEIHKCKYTNTPIQIYKYKNTNTQIQIHK